MAALVVLAGVVWRTGRRRWLVVAPLALAAWGVVALVYTRACTPSLRRRRPWPRTVLSCAVRTELAADGRLHIYPFWYVTATPGAPAGGSLDVAARRGAGGDPAPTPIFNAATAADWPPGTLVDDAYRLPLPAAPPAGTYDLALTVGEDEASMPASVVAQVTFAKDVQTGELPAPAQPVEARFGDAAPHRLRSHGAPLSSDAVARRDVGRARRGVPGLRVAVAGRRTHRRQRPHLRASGGPFGPPVAQEDHLPGPSFRPLRRSGAHSNESRMSFACGCRVRRRAASIGPRWACTNFAAKTGWRLSPRGATSRWMRCDWTQSRLRALRNQNRRWR
ncbi:MAG: hypothetical protein R2851_18615 [Caldilineaceae bacterium]